MSTPRAEFDDFLTAVREFRREDGEVRAMAHPTGVTAADWSRLEKQRAERDDHEVADAR